MITIHYCLRRKSGLSLTEFTEYWKGKHADLVSALADQLGIVSYVQNHAVIPEVAKEMSAMRGSAEPFDGVAAISFASAEDLARSNVDPESAHAQLLLAEDEAKFIDVANSVILFTAAHEVIA